MISDRSDFRVQIRRLFVIMIRMAYRWICNHPFLLSFVGFLYFLHRTCPLLFAPLVSASPVLICTFILLGTILSFGEPSIPEIEKESETVQESALFGTEVSREATVVERGDNSFTVETFVGTEKEVSEDGNGDVDRFGESQLSELEEDGRSFDYRPLVDETLDEIKRDTQVRFEEKAFFLDLEKRGERIEEKLMENGGKQISGAEQSRKNGGSLNEVMDDSKEEQMDVSPVSPWRPMRHEEDDDDDADRDDSLDSGSDGAESSSPDASMTDIIPMLDELHPLLHSEAPSRGIADGEGSDAASEGPHMSSSDEGMESDVDSESHGEEGDNENEEEDDDEEEEEEKKEEKEDESKSAIKWTEADQKNVMDLGSLELERNQRLENLIARRRARHNMRLMAERNLIDLDSVDIPFNMPPISTARQNPFDLPYDSYDDMGLPPIPGSAPSIMFARRNPFDLPYEPNEEKPDLKGDGFEEEFSSQQPKDPVFRRHESFSVGPSMLGGPRNDRLRPFFVLERLANEGTSYYPFERQLSEVSESKVSSVPDTESVCTILEDDEKKVDEHDADRETEIEKVDTASDHDEEKSHSTSDHDEEKGHSSEDSDFDEQADNRNHHHDVAEIILGSAETPHEPSNIMEGETSDKRKLDEEDYSDSDSSLSEKEEKTLDISENEAKLISERKIDLHEESGMSSQTSFGELEVHAAGEVADDYHHDEAPAEGSFITAHPSLEESAISDLCGLVDDHHHKEPVYDSSPSASRFPSFSSVSSDYKPDLPGKNEEEVQENSDIEREVYSKRICPAEIHSTSDETETRTQEVGETSTHVTREASDGRNNSTVSGSEFEDALLDPSSLPLDKNADHLEDDPLSGSSQEDLEELHEDGREDRDTTAVDVSASFVELVTPSEKEVVSTGMVEQQLPIEQTSSPLGYGNTRETVTTLEELPDVVHNIAESSVNRSVAEGIIHEEDEATPQTFNADIPIDSYSALSSGAVEYVETHSFNDEDVPQSEQDPVQSSTSDAKQETHPNQTMDIEVDSVSASGQNVGSEETTPSESDRELTWSDKSVVEQSTLEPDEDHAPTRAGPISVVFSRNITFHEYHDAPEDSAELSCLTSDTSSTPVESPEYETPMVGEDSRAEFFQQAVYEELDHVVERLDQLTDLHAISTSPPEVITEDAAEIKEIDEGLLSELDTIGDFNVKEVVTDSEPGPSSVVSEPANDQTEALPVLEARSVEDIESAFQQINEDFNVKEVVTDSEPEPSQVVSEPANEQTEALPVLEARSVEDIESAFQQINEDFNVKEVVTDSEPEPSQVVSEPANEQTEALPVLEARSVEEIESAFQQINEDFNVTEVVTDSEPGPSSVVSEPANKQTEALPVLEARSVEDIESAFQQINEGSEVEDVILPSTVQDQLSEENNGNATENNSDQLAVVEATSVEDIDNAMKQVVVESMGKQPKSPESDVETEPSVSLVEERSLDVNVPLMNTPEKEEEEETRPKEIMVSDVTNVPLINTPEKEEEEEEETRPKEIMVSDVSSIETQSPEKLPELSEPKEVISERVVIPTEAIGSSNVTLSGDVVTEEVKAETASSGEASVPSPESKEETPEKSGESIAEPKGKEKKMAKSNSSTSSSSSSSSSSDSD